MIEPTALASGQPLPEANPALLERALTYLARISGADTRRAESARRALARWVATDPSHEAAWHQAQRLWHQDVDITTSLKQYLPEPGPSESARRHVLRAFTGLGLSLGAASLLRWQNPQALFRQRDVTAVRQRRTILLPDGSTMDMDAATQTSVAYFNDRREIYLTEGQIQLDVQSDANRPFTVSTPWGCVQVLGTVFTVSARAGHMVLGVQRGQVRVWNGRRRGSGLLLGRGDAVRTNPGGDMERLPATYAQTQDAWRQGWLVFDATPLPEAIAAWNAWTTPAMLLSPSPTLAALRVTGSFPNDQPQRFLEILPSVLPLRVESTPDGRRRILDLREK